MLNVKTLNLKYYQFPALNEYDASCFLRLNEYNNILKIFFIGFLLNIKSTSFQTFNFLFTNRITSEQYFLCVVLVIFHI
jgi:hypothetical protein